MVAGLIVSALALAGISGGIVRANCPNGNGSLFSITMFQLREDRTAATPSCGTHLTIHEGQHYGWDLQPSPRLYFGANWGADNRYKNDDVAVFTVTAGEVTVNNTSVNGLTLLHGLTTTYGDGPRERLGSYVSHDNDGRSHLHIDNLMRPFFVPNGTIDRDVTISLTFTLTGGTRRDGSQPRDEALQAKITVINNADTAPTEGVIVSHVQGTLTEGNDLRYGVRLIETTTSDITVTPSVPAADQHLIKLFNPSSLTFTAANAHLTQFITVRLAEQDNDTVDNTTTISHDVTVSGGGTMTAESVALTIKDAMEVELEVSEMQMMPPTLMLHEGGASDTLHVKLTSAPTEPVTLQVKADGVPGSSIDLSTDTLTFTAANHNEPQSITVRPNEEDYDHENCKNDTFTLRFTSPTHRLLGSTEITGSLADTNSISTGLTPLTLDQRQLFCHERLVHLSGESVQHDPWRLRMSTRFKSAMQHGEERTYQVKLTRDPGQGNQVTVKIGRMPKEGFDRVQKPVVDFPADLMQVKVGSTFGATATLIFDGGVGGANPWNVTQDVTIKAGTQSVDRFDLEAVGHEISGFGHLEEGFIDGVIRGLRFWIVPVP